MSFSGFNDSFASSSDDFGSRSFEDLTAPFPLKSAHLSDGLFPITPLQLLRSLSDSRGSSGKNMMNPGLSQLSQLNHQHSSSTAHLTGAMAAAVDTQAYAPRLNRLQIMHSMPFDDDCLDGGIPIGVNKPVPAHSSVNVNASMNGKPPLPRDNRSNSGPADSSSLLLQSSMPQLISHNHNRGYSHRNSRYGNGNGNGNGNGYGNGNGNGNGHHQAQYSPNSYAQRPISSVSSLPLPPSSSVSSLGPVPTHRSQSNMSHASNNHFHYSSCDDYHSDSYCSEEDNHFGSNPGYPLSGLNHSVVGNVGNMRVGNINVAPNMMPAVHVNSNNQNIVVKSESRHSGDAWQQQQQRPYQSTAVFGYNTGRSSNSNGNGNGNGNGANSTTDAPETVKEEEEEIEESNSTRTSKRVRTKRGRAVYNSRYEGYDCSGAAAVSHLSVHAQQQDEEDEGELNASRSSGKSSRSSTPSPSPSPSLSPSLSPSSSSSGSLLGEFEHIKERIEKTKSMEHLATRVALTNDEIRLSRKEKRRILNQRRRDRLSEGYVKLRELCEMSEKTTTVETMDTAIATIIALQSYIKQSEDNKKKRARTNANKAKALVGDLPVHQEAASGRGRKRRRTMGSPSLSPLSGPTPLY